MAINNFDINDFLLNYWQQKPLLIRNAFPDFENPICADELAGLACEENIESRLITASNDQWQLQHGPFSETDFETLPNKNWTLLVQAVDHWVPAVSQLLNQFRFIPNWRIDDVMASYATEGGSVGPHFDNYDVFLIQGAGTRRWQVGCQYSDNSPMQDNQQLKVLAEFESQQEWVLEKGDMLYLPPLFGHWGTATDNDCMTYSVGFRAPSYADILSDFCDNRIESLKEEMRYSDKAIPAQAHPGEISAATLTEIKNILHAQLDNPENLAEWFGRFVTQAKYEGEQLIESCETMADEDINNALNDQIPLYREPASRFAFIQNNAGMTLFVNGQSYFCDSNETQLLAQLIADHPRIEAEQLQPLIKSENSFNLLKLLIEQSHLYFDDETL